MTIIAYDGKTIAADRQLTGSDDSIMGYVKKIDHWKYGWFACTGPENIKGVILAFLNTGKAPKVKTAKFGCIYTKGKKVFIFHQEFKPWNASTPDALGTGVEGALALMREGYSAKEAVKYCRKYYITCGGKIDVVKINGGK